MVAFAIFALVAVGAISIMNQGTAGAQNTLETTLVRQQVDNQAEMIRFLHQAYIANPEDTTANSPSVRFKEILVTARSAGLTEPSQFGDANCLTTLPGVKFAVGGDGAMIPNVRPINDLEAGAAPYAQLASSGTAYGLWVEPVISNSADSGTRFIDFHIRACWESASSGAQQRTMGTIVRLYVPDNIATGTAGSGSSVIPTPPVPADVTLNRLNLERCFPHKEIQRLSNPANRPSWAPFTISPAPGIGIDTNTGLPANWQCQTQGTAVFNCVNYDSEFNSNNASGNFDLVLEYYDANCGDPAVIPPYAYGVEIFKDGASVGAVDLTAPAILGSGTSSAINIGAVTPTTKIQVRWWNNHHDSGRDPDFAIQQVILKRRP